MVYRRGVYLFIITMKFNIPRLLLRDIKTEEKQKDSSCIKRSNKIISYKVGIKIKRL